MNKVEKQILKNQAMIMTALEVLTKKESPGTVNLLGNRLVETYELLEAENK